MSTANLPKYVDHADPLNRAPSYSIEPHDYERRIALADRLRTRPLGNFVKESKGGSFRLRLTAQEDNLELPVYGTADRVGGTIELSKTEGITCVEVKIEGTLRLKEIAEGGTAVASLVLDTSTLWFKDMVNPTCPPSLSFSLALPTTFEYEGQRYPLPPTFDVKLSGLPGFVGTIEYSVTAIVTKPNSVHIPKVKVNSKALGLHIGTSIVSTPFIYFPRSKPAVPIPLPLRLNRSGFETTPDWKLFQYTLPTQSQSRPDITVKLYIPSSRIFSMTTSIPFHLTLESSAVSLAAYLPMSPTAHTPRKITRIQLMRQTTVDVRNTVVYGAKTDMWRVDCIGEAVFKQVGDGATSMSFTGEIPLDPKIIKVPAFKAAGLHDCILFTVNPLDPKKTPFAPMREVIQIRLATDPWTPNGAGIGAEAAAALWD